MTTGQIIASIHEVAPIIVACMALLKAERQKRRLTRALGNCSFPHCDCCKAPAQADEKGKHNGKVRSTSTR